jgi:hypothetical protein
LPARAALLTGANAPARNGVISEVQQALQVFTRDTVEPNEHNRIWLVMSLQVKNARFGSEKFVAPFESDCDTDRIRLSASMVGLNNENFAGDFERRHSVVAIFLRAWKRESNFSNRIKIGSSHR